MEIPQGEAAGRAKSSTVTSISLAITNFLGIGFLPVCPLTCFETHIVRPLDRGSTEQYRKHLLLDVGFCALSHYLHLVRRKEIFL
jgi:hypothetical protein